jgi:very-short-patch-repair endonuclease
MLKSTIYREERQKDVPSLFERGGTLRVGDFTKKIYMYLNYKKYLKKYSQINRKIPTKSEWLFWHCFLKWDKTWYRFLRQKPIMWYVLDFYCPKLKLAIEIDGSSHEWKSRYDEKRDREICVLWIKTIRYSDNDVIKKLEAVGIDVYMKIEERGKEIKSSALRAPPLK